MFEDFKKAMSEALEKEAEKHNKTKDEYAKDIKDSFLFMGKCIGAGVIIGACAVTGINKKKIKRIEKKYPSIVPMTRWEDGIDRFHLKYTRYNPRKKRYGKDELCIATSADNAIESFESILKEAKALKATLNHE